MTEVKKLTAKQRSRAVLKVAKITYQASPLMVWMQLGGSIIDAVLPLVTTFFAALTTTALAEAFAGDEAAGGRVLTFVIITAVLGVLQTAWASVKQYVTQLMQFKIAAAVSDQMYQHFANLDFWRYDDKDTADTYDKARHFSNFFPYIFERLAGLFSQFIAMVAGVIALFLVSWWLGFIILVAIMPGVIIQLRLSRLQAQHWKNNVEVRRRRSMIEWNMFEPNHIAELRLYGMTRHLLSLRKRLRDADDKQRIDYERQYIFKRLMADVVESAAEVVALIWTVLQIIGQHLPVGHFVYVQQVVSRAMGGASGLAYAINQIDEDLANLAEYQEFMDMPETSVNTRKVKAVPNTITLKEVSFSYPQTKNSVLKGVSFAIKKGQHVAIVGENGAGKSTLIKLLTGLYLPSNGEILLDGEPLAELNMPSWHKKLGVLEQSYLTYGFATAKENVQFGDISRPFNAERFDRALAMAEAQTFLDKLPNGVDSYVSTWMEDDAGNKGVDLSGGQWQRLALARNFYRDAPIIILDEPTSAIDALAESRIFNHLFKQHDKTVITVSHRLSTVKKADVIHMLEDGRVIETGTYAELVKKKGAFYTMFESQM